MTTGTMSAYTIPLTLLAVLHASLAVAQTAPPEQTWFVSDHPFAAPEELGGRVGEASVVVRGVVQSKSAEILPSRDSKFPPILTTYAFVISEIIKGPAEQLTSGSVIRVFRQGGTVTEGGRTLTAVNRGFPELESGEYVLFLAPWPEKQGYRVLWGTDGVFEVGTTTVKARGASRLSKDTSAMPREQFLTQLREAGRRPPQ